jgi:hypothetical protein
MIDAVLAGEGLGRVAALAAAELDGVVAIVLPQADLTVAEPRIPAARLAALSRYVSERLAGRAANVPPQIAAEVPVRSGDERLGSVVLIGARPSPGAPEVLELAALAALTGITLSDAGVTQRRACAALLDDLRGRLPVGELLARARRLGADLSTGASAVCVRPAPGQAERALAAIVQEFPGALAAPRADRVEALLPVPPGGTPEMAEAAARRLAQRLRRTAPTGLSPFEDTTGLSRALGVADLALALGEREGLDPVDLVSGSWRLLLSVAAGDPPALGALVDSTVGPAIGYGRSELLDTLRAYLDHGANMNAAAAAVFAHRHTVASRLERTRELTGHDPQTPHGQAQLALGLQALAVQHAAVRIYDDGTLARLRVVTDAATPP